MSNVMEVKDRIQKEGVNKWFHAGCNGTLQYATGVGKSRCGVLAAGWLVKQMEHPSILIITPTQTIRDQAWIEEFEKWGAKSIFDDCVECVCIQTAYKYVDKHYDLVIADEIHNYIPVSDEYEYFKFFENNKIDKLLGLSASIDEELIPRLDTIAPICDTIDTNTAVELGLVSPFVIYNIPMKMSQEERTTYAKCDAEFFQTFQLFDRSLQTMFACLKSKTTFKYHLQRRFKASGHQLDDIIQQYAAYPYRCNAAMRERKTLLYENATKLKAIGEISKMFSDRKGVIFNQTAAFADQVAELIGDTCIAEHSKVKPAKKRRENLNRFQDGRTKIRQIAAVKSLNEGANLKGVDFVVIASGTSKLKDFIQRVGRSIRWEDGKTAVVVRLFMENSQEEKWVKSSQEGYQVITLSGYEELERRVRDLAEVLDEIETEE
jgi:superfamily II DNA or RNA helicase